jgi:hypothetical protein
MVFQPGNHRCASVVSNKERPHGALGNLAPLEYASMAMGQLTRKTNISVDTKTG